MSLSYSMEPVNMTAHGKGGLRLQVELQLIMEMGRLFWTREAEEAGSERDLKMLPERNTAMLTP